jgi:hypothetical protein
LPFTLLSFYSSDREAAILFEIGVAGLIDVRFAKYEGSMTATGGRPQLNGKLAETEHAKPRQS